MFKLDKLEKTHKARKRIGRGGARGGTSGRGHKGQKARSGHHKMRASFEGGQMPLTRRLPQRGFSNKKFQIETTIVSLALLDKKFDEGAKVDKAALIERGLIKKSVQRIKILGGYDLKKKLSVYADAFSSSAQEVLQKSGGEAHLIVEEG